VNVYGTDFRSTPTFFLQDDHDYFDNDEAWDEIVTFPPVWFQLQLARATQRLYYPEFRPDDNRPPGLPWGSVGDRSVGDGKEAISESWGTLRFGRLAEILLYDVRRTCTLAGPSAVYIDPEAGALAVGAHGGAGLYASGPRSEQSHGLERGKVDGMVSGRARRERQAYDR